jgi:hypothetical protein
MKMGELKLGIGEAKRLGGRTGWGAPFSRRACQFGYGGDFTSCSILTATQNADSPIRSTTTA